MRVVRRHGCGLSVWWVDRCELLLKDDIVFKRLKRLSSTRIHQRSQQQTTFEVDMAMTREWEICFRGAYSFFGDVRKISAFQFLSASGRPDCASNWCVCTLLVMCVCDVGWYPRDPSSLSAVSLSPTHSPPFDLRLWTSDVKM